MAGKAQVSGALLEEVILYLLRTCGYRTITTCGNDPTLRDGQSGIEVHGRGCSHQIDAIADCVIHHPFANPQRLLLEAKFTDQKVGVGVVRNAYGVLSDVSEYWVVNHVAGGIAAGSNRSARGRYHYQYAVFSVTDFTRPAQDYAFAHDIFLLPLGNSHFMRPVLAAIEDLADRFATVQIGMSLGQLRQSIRGQLSDPFDMPAAVLEPNTVSERHALLVRAVRRLDAVLLAMLDNRFPVFLVPNPDYRDEWTQRRDEVIRLRVRIFFDDNGWYLKSSDGADRPLFSFDLPEAMFLRYADQGILTPEAALNLKEQLSRFQAFYLRNGELRLVSFELDQQWFAEVRGRLRNRERR